MMRDPIILSAESLRTKDQQLFIYRVPFSIVSLGAHAAEV